VERLTENGEKTKQDLTQAVAESRSELLDVIGATQETVEVLKSRHLEIQTLVEGIESYRMDSERAIAAFREETEHQLRNYLTNLGGQSTAPPADIEALRSDYRSTQEKVSEVVNENKRIQGELQDELQYRTRESREQLTGLIDRKTHQFHESFTTLVEHKDTMIKSMLLSAARKQRTFTLLVFLLSLMLSFALFYFGRG
jgi:hypothetical protein